MNKKAGMKWETEPPTSFNQVLCSIDADLLMADVAFKTALNQLKRKENQKSHIDFFYFFYLLYKKA